jgi:CRISPR-associated DxTHG motif protein
MKKAVITILGTIGSRFDSQKKELVLDDKSIVSEYYSDTVKSIVSNKNINTLPLLIDNYKEKYDIIPISTSVAKDIQIGVLEKLENKTYDINIFKDDYLIQDENNFNDILSQIDTIINQYDTVIVDVSHGFRHLPILIIIDLIMQNIKNSKKIEHILFAQEEIKPDKSENIEGQYKIIDLKDYLDLSNLSFIITNFKDNYTISSNINISNHKYKRLIQCMRSFSRDILALSMHNLLTNTIDELIKEIDTVKDNFILKDDLIQLKEHLQVFKFNGQKKYVLYFNIAKDLMQKDYLLQSVNLVHEAKLIYLKSAIKSQNDFNYQLIEKLENQIKKNPTKKLNTYKLLADCQYIYTDNRNKVNIFNPDGVSRIKNSIGKTNSKFVEFLFDDLRNSLSHANSLEERDNVKGDVAKNIQKFEQLCIEQNILNLKIDRKEPKNKDIEKSKPIKKPNRTGIKKVNIDKNGIKREC